MVVLLLFCRVSGSAQKAFPNVSLPPDGLGLRDKEALCVSPGVLSRAAEPIHSSRQAQVNITDMASVQLQAFKRSASTLTSLLWQACPWISLGGSASQTQKEQGVITDILHHIDKRKHAI